MRALLLLLSLVSVCLGGLRVWLAYSRSKTQISRTARILWRVLDVYLIILAVAAAIVLIVVLIGVGINVWDNIVD